MAAVAAVLLATMVARLAAMQGVVMLAAMATAVAMEAMEARLAATAVVMEATVGLYSQEADPRIDDSQMRRTGSRCTSSSCRGLCSCSPRCTL